MTKSVQLKQQMQKLMTKPKPQTMKRYKFLRTGMKSELGSEVWKTGKWKSFNDNLKMCQSGFHCSRGIYQAFSYVQGEILAEIEVGGKHIIRDDKEVWEKMRIIRSWKWQKKDSVLLAIFAARLALPNFEKVFPKDDIPRKAIEAAENWVKHPNEKNRLAAKLARSAESAACSAAWSAAWSAKSATWSAESVESAKLAVYKKLDSWMLRHIRELEETK